jgi:hypothetical protein
MMDKTVKRYSSLDAMKADGIRAWQRVPASERIRAVSELTTVLYALKGQPPDVQRLQRTLVRVKRPPG